MTYSYKKEKFSLEIPEWKDMCSNDTKYSNDSNFKTEESNESIEPGINGINKNYLKEKSQLEKVKEVKEYCLKVRKSGLDVSYTALVDNFDVVTISKLIENGQLIKLPKCDCYLWEDS